MFLIKVIRVRHSRRMNRGDIVLPIQAGGVLYLWNMKKCHFSVLNHSVITHKPDGSVRSGALNLLSWFAPESAFLFSHLHMSLFILWKKTNKPWYESDNEGERERKESTQVTAWACTDEKTKQKVNRNFFFFFPGLDFFGLTYQINKIQTDLSAALLTQISRTAECSDVRLTNWLVWVLMTYFKWNTSILLSRTEKSLRCSAMCNYLIVIQLLFFLHIYLVFSSVQSVLGCGFTAWSLETTDSTHFYTFILIMFARADLYASLSVLQEH